MKARDIWRRDPTVERSLLTEERDFRASFGCGVIVLLSLWELLMAHDMLPPGGTLEHLLWTCMFLKVYGNQRTLCTMAGGVDQETFRKWVWKFIAAIAPLESSVVSSQSVSLGLNHLFDHETISSWLLPLMMLLQIIWENRLKCDKGNDCLISVDGTDFPISQKGPKFSSHMFMKKSGLRYEVGLCILTGDIVWVNGPYECGMWNDITIFRDSLKWHLLPGERVEADDGYLGEHPQYVKCPAGFANPVITEYMQQRVRNRQESVNRRFKNFGILKQVFRHDEKLSEHGDIFRAVAIITQLAINQDEKLFECGYRDPPYGITDDEAGDADDFADL
jgi:hypothetical protein